MQFATPTVGGTPAAYIYKFMYEFWCYVVNGGASPTTPGGLASPTPTTFPANGLEGTSVVNSGTDGVTTLNQSTFDSASASFLTSVVGKYLVVWSDTSPGPEDGIYKITARLSATQLTVNVANGGTPAPVTLRPRLTARTGLRYRVVDVEGSIAAGWSAGQYIVIQMTPSISNPGQANSQVQCTMQTTTQGAFVGSPAGTWTGSAFTDPMASVTTTSNGGGWFNGTSSAAVGQISMWGDKDGMISWFKTNFISFASYFHFEAPIRLASAAQDPNPLLVGTDGVCTLYLSSFGAGYNSFHMAGTDGVNRRHRMLVKCLSGDGNGEAGRPTGTISFFGDSRITIVPPLNKTFLSKILIGQVGSPSSQFSLARAVMRYARICPNTLPAWVKVGNSGEYLHVQNGICFPWDNCTLGSSLVTVAGY
jgi:hypothetical protein